jgi:hypothetical protein
LDTELFSLKKVSSLILTHIRLRLELYMVNLIWKSLPKVMKIPKHHLIFMNFGVKNFTIEMIQKKTLIFDCYNLIDFDPKSAKKRKVTTE